MKTYNTYQEAKIANPECEIYQLERNGLFAHCDHHKAELVRFIEFDSAGIKCNPADYCMTVEKFLRDFGKLPSGGLVVHPDGSCNELCDDEMISICSVDLDSFVVEPVQLEAQPMDSKFNIDNLATQTPEEKEVLDAVDFSRACEIGRSKLKSNPVIQLSIDEIEKFSGNEWNGEGLPPVGVECDAVFIEHEHKGYGEFLVLGYHGNYVWMEYIGELPNKSKHYTAKIDLVKFRKPESPQQREERERLEAAYDLYCEWCIAMRYPKFSFEQFTACERDKAGMLAVVDKTNYRKESN